MQLTVLLVIAAFTSSPEAHGHQQEIVEVIVAEYGETCPPEEVRMKILQNITTRVKAIISSTYTVTITSCSTLYTDYLAILKK